jgi:ketosteroid isomerase-like protein
MTDGNDAAPTPLRRLVDQTFAAVMAKDLDATLACFADGASLIDPHYPTPTMIGKPAIEDGLRWGFGSMRSFGFRIVNYFEASGRAAAVEVDTFHVLKVGIHLNFPQAFFVDAANGKIERLQAYEPYGPNGMGGIMLTLTRLGRRMTGK